MGFEFDYIYDNISKLTYSEIKKILIGFKIEEHDRCDVNRLINVLQGDNRINVSKISDMLRRSVDNYEKEVERVKRLYAFDKGFGDYYYVAGVDEVGRGPLAGPIVAAAVIMNLNICDEAELILGVDDSKKLSEKQREELAVRIKEKAVCYNIASLSNDEIDSKGISYCNNEVFREACRTLRVQPELVLTDGYPIKNFDIENKFVIKGDTKSFSIACASIIAKVYRDNLMKQYGEIYPQYGFDKNAGYGTKEHMDKIRSNGVTPIHRKSFLKGIIGEEVL